MEIVAGVYKITNMVNGKFYIGSSLNISKRWEKHRYELRKNKHCNRHLQSAWNKYGDENFKFEVIAEIKDKDMILPVEQLYIEMTKCYISEIGYNKDVIAKSSYGYVTTKNEEIIKIDSERRLRKKKNPNPNKGVKLTDEQKGKISKGSRGKNNKGQIVLTEKDVEEIMILFHNGLSIIEVQEFYYVDNNALNKIKSGKTWNDIKNSIDFNSPLPSKLSEIINKVIPNRKRSKKLTNDQIKEIEKLLSEKEITQNEISKRLGVNLNQVKRIASSRYKNKGK
jgi:group I intron endonuclease